jgi:UDP-N-acetylmuramoyl-L-alanyl-D-glutamate--2,6-diaminopimelate ligase
MVQKIRQLIKKYIPKSVLNLRHLFFAWYGAVRYGHPSNELLVIGVTGTSGKSTTVFLLRTMLEAAGYRVGSLSTIDFYIAGEDTLNDQKMTMLGKTRIQKYLRQMVDKKCDIAIVETTSEGAVQYRHVGINYDLMILTNLYPEHIDSHGSFEKYKQAKISIFEHASRYGRKKKNAHKLGFDMLAQEDGTISKIALVHGDSVHTPDFFSAGPFDQRYAFGVGDRHFESVDHHFRVSDVRPESDGISFVFDGTRLSVPLYGVHNAQNCAIAFSVLLLLGASGADIRTLARVCTNAPGRNEFISEAESYGFRVIVDYAFEPKAIEALYTVVAEIQPKRIVHVLGSTGGGRDVSRRFSVGEYVGKHADIVFVTDEDPYDDDPVQIMRDVAGAVEKKGKNPGKDLFIIEERREAIERAIMMAEAGDIVLITGKGSEQGMCVAGGVIIPWDDRVEVRRALEIRGDHTIKKEIKSLWSS